MSVTHIKGGAANASLDSKEPKLAPLLSDGALPEGDVPFQPASIDTWISKYQLKDQKNVPIDATMGASLERTAEAVANVETSAPKRRTWKRRFLEVLKYASGGGRIMSNAGAELFKPGTSLINCTVSLILVDSLDGIMEAVKKAAATLKAGCGIGYDFTVIRPMGAFIRGSGAATSGPISFMGIFNEMCKVLVSAGGRRGAQMGVLDVIHPDIEAFIQAKKEVGQLSQFNLSVLARHDFIKAVLADGDWKLCFPAFDYELESEDHEIVYRAFPGKREWYTRNEQGLVACRVYKTVKAKYLWNLIMESTYDCSDPGFILIDEYNEMNNNWWCEDIRTTNPCGEQGLPYNGACLLGSLLLTRFIVNPFTDEAYVDWDKFVLMVHYFSRFLDNVVELNGLPHEEQREEIFRKRRHGMGYTGLGSAMVMLGISYGSEESVALTEEFTKRMAVESWRAALDLAKEKGSAPIMSEKFEVTTEMLIARPEMIEDGYSQGDMIEGRLLHCKYSRYMQRLAGEEPELVEELSKVGPRYSHATSIAPTGTMSMTWGNNCSGGIEPSFGHAYTRNVIVEGRKTKLAVDVFSFELLAYDHYIGLTYTDGSTLRDPERPLLILKESQKSDEELIKSLENGGKSQVAIVPDSFVDASDITPSQHVAIQAAAQKWVDSSISKTVTVPTEISFEDFQNVYLEGIEKGLKGCTTYRFNPDRPRSVLVKQEDLEKTLFYFQHADGSEVCLKGNEKVEYDGEITTAANLHEALEEGYYGMYA